MKKYLIEDKKYYKANLHCHSVKSDGAMTPEELKSFFQKLGYSIVAFTDHTYIEDFNSYLSDESFIAINGYENAIRKVDENGVYNVFNSPVYHFCFFATDKNYVKLHGINELDYTRWQNSKSIENRKELLAGGEFSPVTYDVSSINEMIKEANENGFLVQYNHACWSLQSYEDYIGLKGLWSMEVYNHDCFLEGFNDFNEHVYDDMLKKGATLCVTANDDNHSWMHIGGGFNYIGANELSYEGVIDAMKRKDIYASQAPTFEYIYIEDGKVYIKTSNVTKISMISNNRKRASTRFDIDEENMIVDYTRTGNTAVFEIPTDIKYLRFEIIDVNGKKAWTRAYFKDEL